MFFGMASKSASKVVLPPHPATPVHSLDAIDICGPWPPGHGAGSRWDPVYERKTGWMWAWGSRRKAEMIKAMRLRTGRSRDLRVSVDEARRRVLRDPEAILALGALNQWVCLTSQQISAVVGWPIDRVATVRPWRKEARVLRLLWTAGLVEVGELAGTGAMGPRAWRLLPDEGFDERLGVDARFTVHGGLGWTVGPVGEDHSIVAAEVGLRLAEVGTVEAVVGEPLSAHRLLLPSSETAKTPATFDLTVYGTSGLILAVEVTRTRARKDIRRKAARIVKSLTSMPPGEASRVAVCFLDAVTPGDPHGSAMTTLCEEVESALRAEPSSIDYGLRDRIFMARWSDWFPGPGTANLGWWELPAYKAGMDGFEPVMASSVTWDGFAPDRRHDEAVAATRFLGGTPAVLRANLIEEHGNVDLEALYLAHTGLDALLRRS
jgi:hypothetical protein